MTLFQKKFVNTAESCKGISKFQELVLRKLLQFSQVLRWMDHN